MCFDASAYVEFCVCDVMSCVVRTDVSEESITSIIRVKNSTNQEQLQLLVTANGDPSSLILFNLMMEVIRFFNMLALTRAARRHIQRMTIFIQQPLWEYNLHRNYIGN
jgi:hypothetical protein